MDAVISTSGFRLSNSAYARIGVDGLARNQSHPGSVQAAMGRMDTEDFEALLEGARETPQLEFKESMPWNARSLGKHIVAMSNLRDGGRIVIGIQDGTLVRIGVDEGTAATYVDETMQDQIAALADPHIQFTVSRPRDRHGVRFIVITVASFEETPTILRETIPGNQQGEAFERGRILIRSRYGRPKSAQVERVDELRELIELAVARRHARLQAIGLLPRQAAEQQEPPAAYDYDAELEGL